MSAANGGNPARKPFPRPYRDTVLVYGALAIVVVIVATASGGNVWWALVAAGAAFVLAVGWTWRSLRLRERGRQ